MLKFVALALGLAAGAAGAAHAQNITRVDILETGVYSASQRRANGDGGTTSTDYSLVKAGKSIDHTAFQVTQFSDGQPRIGFWWYLHGSPVGEEVQIKVVQINPDSNRYETMWTRIIEDKAWNGVRLNDWQGWIGRTVFQGWYGDKKLFEVAFDVR